jgi:hypothetical protein
MNIEKNITMIGKRTPKRTKKAGHEEQCKKQGI